MRLRLARCARARGCPRPRRDRPEPVVIVLDPGHDQRGNPATEPIGPGSPIRKIKDGGGTRGVVSGLTEAELNLLVAQRLRPLLERAGVRVVMTRTKNAGASMGNIARARIANRAGAGLFLRLHADGSTDRSVRGTHTLLPGTSRRVDQRRLCVEQACGPDRAVRARPSAGLSRQRPSGALGLHGVQLGRRAGDPRRDGLHDEPDRGPAARDAGLSATSRKWPLQGSAALPRTFDGVVPLTRR